MDERGYRAASFLDDRILAPATQGAWLPGAAVTEASAPGARPAPAALHLPQRATSARRCSRACSTRRAPVLSLREPLPLRTLADAHDVLGRPESLLGPRRSSRRCSDMRLRLWSRGYDRNPRGRRQGDEQRRAAGVRVLARVAGLPRRLPQPARGALSRDAARRRQFGDRPARPRPRAACAPARRPRTSRSQPLHALSPGELAALGWLVESLSRAAGACGRSGARVLALDFDAFLADVRGRARARRAATSGSAAGRRLDRARRPTGPVLAPVFQGAGAAVSAGRTRAPRLAASRAASNRDEIAHGTRLARAHGPRRRRVASLLADGAPMNAGVDCRARPRRGPRAGGPPCRGRSRLPQLHRGPAAGRRGALQFRLFPAAPRPARGGARRAPGGARPRDRAAGGSPVEHGRDPDGASARRAPRRLLLRARARDQSELHRRPCSTWRCYHEEYGDRRARARPCIGRSSTSIPSWHDALVRIAHAETVTRCRRRGREAAAAGAAALEPRAARRARACTSRSARRSTTAGATTRLSSSTSRATA